MKQIILTPSLILTPHRLPQQDERQIREIVKTMEKMLKKEQTEAKVRLWKKQRHEGNSCPDPTDSDSVI